jgi:hypothetical protein
MSPGQERQLQIRSIIHAVPLCGCGSSETMWKIVHDILKRAAVSGAGRLSFYDPMPEHELSGIAVEFIAQALDKIELLEHGTGIGYAWLTRAGAMLLGFLDEFAKPDSWPKWAKSCPAGETFALSHREMKGAGLFVTAEAT